MEPSSELLPWSGLREIERRVTVVEIGLACGFLPEPRTQSVGRRVENVRAAATLVPIIDVDGEAAVVLTQRPTTMTYHRGEWVFPGGVVDPCIDDDAASAARREVEEELGIPVSRIDIVGQLDSHGPISTGFLIEVFVGLVCEPVELKPDRREVAAVAVVPLSRFLEPGAFHTSHQVPIGHDSGPVHGEVIADSALPTAIRFFTVANEIVVWGTQGNIVWNLLEVIMDGRNR